MFGAGVTAAAASYDMIIVDDGQEQLARIANSRKVDGIILSRYFAGDESLLKLAQYGVPIVLTGSTAVPGIIQVSYDARAAFRNLTSRLIDLWDGEIGLILTDRLFPANKTRAEGYNDAITSKSCHSAHVIWDAVDEQAVYQAFISLYDKGIRNIICGDDSVCTDLLYAIGSGNVFEKRITPGVTGHDGLSIASFHGSHYLKTFHPEIPLVELDPSKLGEVACRLLIKKLEGGEIPETTLLEYSIHI
jgi:DNA-binding LacI/PurR family transcriptional regulator